MGAGATSRIKEEVQGASPEEIEAALKELEDAGAQEVVGKVKTAMADAAKMDKVVISGDYAVLGASVFDKGARDIAVPFKQGQGKKLVCIVDACRPDVFFSKFFWYNSNACLNGHLDEVETFILLMPGMNSDPLCYGSSLLAGMQGLLAICGAVEDAEQKVRVVLRDYYFSNPLRGDAVPPYLEQDAKIFPGSMRDTMTAWIDSFKTNIWTIRAGIHWACGFGCEMDEIEKGIQVLDKVLKEGAAGDVEYDGSLGSLELVQHPKPRARFAFGDVHGMAEEMGLQQWDTSKAYDYEAWSKDEAEISFFADIESVTNEFQLSISKLREHCPCCSLTVVSIAKDFESFKCPNAAVYMNTYIENCDINVFATLEDVEKIKSVFLAESPFAPGSKSIALAMVPFPRLHFVTLLGEDGKTCGQEVPDTALLFSSLKFGPDAPTLPASKFSGRPLMKGIEHVHYATVVGDSKATVITPVPILKQIFEMAATAEITLELEDWQKEETTCNVEDLISEIGQYADPVEYEEEEEAPAAPAAPDGTLESANSFIAKLNWRSLKELRSMKKPPPRCLLPLKAAAILLECEVAPNDEWTSLQQMLTGKFLTNLTALQEKKDDITEEQWAAVKELTADELFTYEEQSRSSLVTGILTAWILAFIPS